MMNSKMVIEKIKDIKDEIETISPSGFSNPPKHYRGLSKSYPLESRLMRCIKEKEIANIIAYEKEIIESARHILSIDKGFTDTEVIALCQHLEVPTRFLDWTFSLEVAICFSVNNTAHLKDDGVIWIYTVERKDVIENTDKGYFKRVSSHEDLLKEKTKMVKIISLLDDREEDWGLKRRMRQHGVFTITNEEDAFTPFDAIESEKKKLFSVKIPSSSKEKLIKELNSNCDYYKFLLIGEDEARDIREKILAPVKNYLS